MTRLLRKFYKAKCVESISITGIGDCIVGKIYVLDEEQARYNGAAFDIEHAEITEEIMQMDEGEDQGQEVLTKQQLLAKQFPVPAEPVAPTGEPITEDKAKEMRLKVLNKLLKDPLTEIAQKLGLTVGEEETRGQIIAKIVEVEFKPIP